MFETGNDYGLLSLLPTISTVATIANNLQPERGWIHRKATRSFSTPKRPDRLAVEPTKLPMQWVMGEVLQGIRRSPTEAELSLPLSAKLCLYSPICLT
jgi:hypothetical protein